MKRNSKFDVALLWDESFLWGLMAYKALNAARLTFDLIRSEDVRNGKLKEYKMLFVPGGWASNKLKSLGEEGVWEIKKFVKNGGSYLGFCGGAGLATLDGMGLLNIKRKPTKERVPSFSGRIRLNVNEHKIWGKQNTEHRAQSTDNPPFPPFKKGGEFVPKLQTHNSKLVFHAWWPSQLLIEDKKIKVLASYGEAMPDSFSSDLNIGDVEANGDWAELERNYGINLDPKRLLNEPAVVEATYGKGKVVLSLIHFDTPEDVKGQTVLRNLWEYLGGRNPEPRTQNPEIRQKINKNSLCSVLCALCSDLISLGERNFLWYWRNPMLLQWRRGVRGLEYCTLYGMVKEIAAQNTEDRTQNSDKKLGGIKDLFISFTEKAKRLLLLERLAMQQGPITYEKCDDPEIQSIRTELFSASKSHGGMFKELIDEIDKVLYSLLKPIS